MDQKNGQWIQSRPDGAKNGRELGARTGSSNPSFPDFPGVKSGADPVGPGSGNFGNPAAPSGLSASLTFDFGGRGTNMGSTTVGSLPPGLGARNDHDNHVSIYPTVPMTFSQYQWQLNHVPWQNAAPRP